MGCIGGNAYAMVRRDRGFPSFSTHPPGITECCDRWEVVALGRPGATLPSRTAPRQAQAQKLRGRHQLLHGVHAAALGLKKKPSGPGLSHHHGERAAPPRCAIQGGTVPHTGMPHGQATRWGNRAPSRKARCPNPRPFTPPLPHITQASQQLNGMPR